MKNILLLIIFTFIFLACGGNDSRNIPDAPGINPPTGETKMKINEIYSVSPGDQILSSNSLTRIKVTHVDGSRGSSVVLIEGNAILRIN